MEVAKRIERGRRERVKGGGSEIYILGKSFEVYRMSNNINETEKQKKQKYKRKYKTVYIVDRLVYNLTLTVRNSANIG